MIINNDVAQGTVEWLISRLGVATASQFGNIVTSTGKKASGQTAYAYKLVAEQVTGEPLDGFGSLEMFTGKSQELESKAAYTLLTGHSVKDVGFIYMDESKRVGCSPDGLTKVGGLEMKNVQSNTQVSYLWSGKVPAKYRPQVYGCMYITERESWDFLSCSPGFEPLLVTTESTDDDYLKYIDVLDKELPIFLDKLATIYTKVTS